MKAGFSVFLAIWNHVQGFSTPDIHFKIADWLERCWKEEKQNLCLLAFRSCGKSTLVALFSTWLLYRDNNLRILVLAAETSLAAKMAANIRRIIEKHPLTDELKPRIPEQWSGERFTVKRAKELRDPSVSARGITANMTGARADIIICDDVEVPNTCDTADKRAELRERLSEIDFIQTGQGFQLYVGTPHSYYTIYTAEPRCEIGEEKGFLQGFDFMRAPLLNPNGTSAWPQRFNIKQIEALRMKVGPNKFASQMMLQPVNILNGRLNPSLLKRYEDSLEYLEVQGKPVLKLNGEKLVSASAWWDPAFGSGSDASVVAVIFIDKQGKYYIQNVSYLNINKLKEQDEATQQCQLICDLAARYYLPSIAVETNGIGKFLPSILRRELAKRNLSCAVLEQVSARAKDLRILEAFDAPMAAGALYAHASVYETGFIREMQEWRPGKSNGRDDALDAVAGALSMEPVRLPRLFTCPIHPSWKGSATTHRARTVEDI